jgi:AhpD family alkylhydroperoxidase
MARENYREIAPEAYRALGQLNGLMHQNSLEPLLVDLVYLRVSQLNGCAYCVDAHSYEALEKGETPQRLYNLTVWRETPFFTPREQAALAWAEAMTRLPAGHPPEALHEATR